MPSESDLTEAFENAFVINQPMDTVGGDGFWVYSDAKHKILVVFDCMGHGRMAAMMNAQYLDAIEKVITQQGQRRPSEILSHVHLIMKQKFEGKRRAIGTGVDIAVLCRPIGETHCEFAGARMDLLQANQKGETNRIRGERSIVGQVARVLL